MNPENAKPEIPPVDPAYQSLLAEQDMSSSLRTNRDEIVNQVVQWSSRIIIPVLGSEETRDLIVAGFRSAMERLEQQEGEGEGEAFKKSHQQYWEGEREYYATLDPNTPEAIQLQEEIAQAEAELARMSDEESTGVSDRSNYEELENIVSNIQSDPVELRKWAEQLGNPEFIERSELIEQLNIKLSEFKGTAGLSDEVVGQLINSLREIAAPNPSLDGPIRILLTNYSGSQNPISESDICAAYRREFPNREEFVRAKAERFTSEVEYWEEGAKVFIDCFKDSEIAPILNWVSSVILNPEVKRCFESVNQRCTEALADVIYDTV